MSILTLMPVVVEYDPTEVESLQKALRISDKELFEFAKLIGQTVNGKDDDDPAQFAQNMLMQWIQEERISANLLLYLACKGSTEVWQTFGDGILLMLDADKEQEE